MIKIIFFSICRHAISSVFLDLLWCSFDIQACLPITRFTRSATLLWHEISILCLCFDLGHRLAICSLLDLRVDIEGKMLICLWGLSVDHLMVAEAAESVWVVLTSLVVALGGQAGVSALRVASVAHERWFVLFCIVVAGTHVLQTICEIL